MRSRFLVALVPALMMLLTTSTASAQDEADGREVRVALHADEKNLNPFLEPRAQPLTHDLTMLVYDTLFWSQNRLAPEPWLATEAVASEDFRTWTVSLRSGVTWHDGEPFTADDVAFTFRYFSEDAGPGRYGRHVYQYPTFASATVIDEATVQLSFVEPVATFELIPGGDLPILPQHIWEGIEDPRADATSLPIGTGPFRMVDYQPGSSYRFEANQDYFLGAPLVDALTMSIIPDDQSAFAALEAGEIDIVPRNVPIALTDQIEVNDDLDIVGASRLQSVFLQFNLRQPVLQSQQVRQALGLALDTHLILDVIEGGAGRLGTDTWTHPNSPWTRDPTGAHLSDQLAAGQLLDAAGYASGADGIRVKPDGQPLSLSLGVDGSLANHVRAAELVAEQLATTGVAVVIERLDAAAFAEAGSGPAVDMMIGEQEAHAHADPNHLFHLFHSINNTDEVFGGYTNPNLDALLEDALDEPAEAGSRLSLVNSAQDILAQDLPALVLYYPAGRIAYRPSAYDGWTSDQGHGVFTKRSFLETYADVGDDSHLGARPDVPAFQSPEDALAEEGGGGLGLGAYAIIGLFSVAAVAAFGLGLRSRQEQAAMAAADEEHTHEVGGRE